MKVSPIFSKICLLACLALFVSCSGSNEPGPEDKPNVVIINVDDLGYGDVGAYGATHVQTPAIDQLASEGCIFTDAHSASAVCSASRYALLTGQYPFRTKVKGAVMTKHTLQVDTARMTIAKVMKQAGYATAVIGKWHLGFTYDSIMDWNKELKPGPLELGFDYYFGIPVVSSHPPFVYAENHHIVGFTPDDPMVYGKRAETRWFPEKFRYDWIGGGRAAHALYDDRMIGTTFKEKAVAWIKEHKDESFFLYLATTNIHTPYTPATRFMGTSEAGRYGDFIHELDWIVSEVLNTLNDEGLKDNTLVILTSDNGAMICQGGQDAWKAGHRINDGLLGFKFDVWEGGQRVPFIARWPGKIKAGTKSDQLLCNVDMLASLAALTGYRLKPGEGPDSYNMLPVILGETDKQLRDHVLLAALHPEHHLALRKGKWVYIGAQGGGGWVSDRVGEHSLGGPPALLFTGEPNSDIENGKIKPDAPPVQLYDLAADLAQSQNLAREYPEVVQEMDNMLQEIKLMDQTRPDK